MVEMVEMAGKVSSYSSVTINMQKANSWAVVRVSDNTVANIIRWNGQGVYPAPEGMKFVNVEGKTLAKGWILQEDGSFIEPPQPVNVQ
jgi:hypothetical protein